MLQQFFENPLFLVVFVPVLLFTIAIHEYAHARMADYLGDPTGRLMGRMTINPLAHIDLFGLLFLFLFGFGWGKPVPFDPFNLKNPRRDAAIISLAGPVSNFTAAILCSFLLKLITFFPLGIISTIGSPVLQIIISFNILLGVFNLVPIAPLDGFKIVGGILPEKKAHEWYQLERYGIIFLLVLIMPVGRTSMLTLLIMPIIDFLTRLLI
ncbi:MAG TPA: site-2 protease family protein [Patescibacteria group bacterium]|nr:site-2 protease family protein [Patescibacteria group bacterium]